MPATSSFGLFVMVTLLLGQLGMELGLKHHEKFPMIIYQGALNHSLEKFT